MMRKVIDEVTHIVEEYKIGNTTVKIADNYCRDTTPEQVKMILQSIAQIYIHSIEARQAANNTNI